MSEHFGFYVSDIGRLMRKHFDAATRDIGVTGPQWRLLFTLHRQPGINQGQLADRLEVEPITTCRMVDRLEQAGLVERRRDPADRRAWQIFITDAALPLIEELREIAHLKLAEAVAGFTPEEVDTLTQMLARLRDNLLEDPAPFLKAQKHG
ncbi:MAG: MarR family winged helix-turn-helix transcriptional regulator [Sphingobium phenoxybenzoativorans]|uniref:MarR family transcriptional regulator n=1 Tax=Sphingobium phenoxybenzoativorans TaxID=1592790 RepID=A0A975KAT8_9SPHN|nr:MarR family transcriptional regulator [Sphingobium phenoxybenzoativorans]QUT07973.1 MarR family transcriptional regulator [Sphingobium phenoxybenzoativorans]